MANGGGSTITIKKLLWAKPFNRGFKEAQEGLPLDYDAYPNDEAAQWSYERGRQFGIVYQGKVKYGKEVSWNAINSFYQAWLSKSVV